MTEALKDVDPDRKCYRLVGGVLVESTVKEVLPSLQANKEMVSSPFRNVLRIDTSDACRADRLRDRQSEGEGGEQREGNHRIHGEAQHPNQTGGEYERRGCESCRRVESGSADCRSSGSELSTRPTLLCILLFGEKRGKIILSNKRTNAR